MKVNSVKSKSIRSNSFRFDPSFHLSDAIQIANTLKRSPYPLTEIGKCSERVFLGNIFSRIFVKDAEHGMPYLAASDTVLENLDTGLFLSKKQADSLKHLMLRRNWILITCSGTVGDVTYTNANFENRIATHDLIRVVPSDKVLKKGVVYAYLASKFGYSLLTQSEFGGVVKHINDHHVKSIPVPVFATNIQNEVNVLVEEAAVLREKAHSLLKSSMQLLDSYIGKKFKRTCSKTQIVSSQDVFNSLRNRLDPPALINESIDFMTQLQKKFDLKKISEIRAEVYRPGIFKRCYVDMGLPYIKGSEIFEQNPFRRCAFLSKTKTPFVDQMALKEGQILITCAGSVGDVKLITKEFEDKGAIGSQDIIRVNVFDSLISKEYLFVYLQMPFVQDYIQSMKYGSVIERIEPFHVESIPVVVPSEGLNRQVSEQINCYMNCLYKAFCKEEKAISILEQEIESWNA